MASSILDKIDKDKLPKHIAVIMDGNGRWAKERFGRNRMFGHAKGVKAVRETTEACAELGIPYLTLYAFSTENWGRPVEEVGALMDLLIKTIQVETKQLYENNIRLNAIGNIESLPKKCYDGLIEAMDKTKDNQHMTLTLALSYSARWEITEATKRIAQDVQSGKLEIDSINEQLINNYLSTWNIPDPDLLIRTSGEQRISNYLLWQIAYSELYFTPKYWPEFNKEEFYKAIYDYQQRERRYGKVLQ